jgi:hypothetical protein
MCPSDFGERGQRRPESVLLTFNSNRNVQFDYSRGMSMNDGIVVTTLLKE